MDSVGLQSSRPSVEDVERGAMRFRLLESSMENLKINQQNQQSTIHNPAPVYACAIDGCNRCYFQWGATRRHMKQCEHGPYVGKPKNQICLDKAKSIKSSYPNQYKTFIAQNHIPSKKSNHSYQQRTARRLIVEKDDLYFEPDSTLGYR